MQVGLTGHAVVADGYGYHDGKLYIHINYGYGGTSDGWYDTTTDINGKNIEAMVANIFPPTRGARHSSIVSGRILDANGNPVANASVTATDLSSYATVSTNSNAKGIYAFILPAGDYSLSATSAAAVGGYNYTVVASSQKTRAEGDGWGSGVNNSIGSLDINVYSESDFGKCWRNNAGDGLFSNPQNWSGGTLPASGEDVTVIATGEPLITSASDMTLGTVTIPFGVARFGGSGVITFGGVNVSAGATLATGGALRFSSVAIPSGTVVEITGAEGLVDGGVTGAGRLVIDPGTGVTFTMPKNNTGFTGEAVVKSGTVKFGDTRSFGAKPANIRVKGGATLDENNVSDNSYAYEAGDGKHHKNFATLEQGARLVSSPGVSNNNAPPLTSLSLEGDATVDSSAGNVSISQDWNLSPTAINLGTNTLSKTGSGDFYIGTCTISGTGEFDIQEGRVLAAPTYYNYYSTRLSCANGTVRVGSGTTLRLLDYNNQSLVFTINKLSLDGTVERQSEKQSLSVTGSITGSGTTAMLAMQSGAVFKPSGTGYLTITDSLSGTLKLDVSDPGLSKENKIPLVKVPSALAGSVIFDDLPKNYELRVDEVDGNVEYWLKRIGFSIILR